LFGCFQIGEPFHAANLAVCGANIEVPAFRRAKALRSVLRERAQNRLAAFLQPGVRLAVVFDDFGIGGNGAGAEQFGSSGFRVGKFQVNYEIDLRDLHPRYLRRQVGQDLYLQVSILGRLLEPDTHLPNLQYSLPVSTHPQTSFAHPTPIRLDFLPVHRCSLNPQIPMTVGDEIGTPADHLTQELHRAKVAILDPDIPLLHQGQDLADQRPLLSVGVFTRDDVGDQHQGRVEDNQTLPWQWASTVSACDSQTSLCGGQVVAVEDPHAVARQQTLAPSCQLGDQCLTPVRDVTDQSRRHASLDVLKFVVDRLEGNGDLLTEVLVRGLYMESLTANDQAHQVDGRGE